MWKHKKRTRYPDAPAAAQVFFFFFDRFISCCVVNYSSPAKVGALLTCQGKKKKIYSRSKFSSQSSKSVNDPRKIKINALLVARNYFWNEMYLCVGGSSIPNLSPAVSVHRRICIRADGDQKKEVKTNHCPKIVRFGCAHRRWLSGLFLRTCTPLSHAQDDVVELRGFTRCPFGSLDRSSSSISLCALRSQRCARCCLVVLQREHLEEEGRGFAWLNGFFMFLFFFKLSRTWNCEGKKSNHGNFQVLHRYYPNKASHVESKSKRNTV